MAVDGGDGTAGVAGSVVEDLGRRTAETVVSGASAGETVGEVAGTATASSVEGAGLAVRGALACEEHILGGAAGADGGTAAALTLGITGVALTTQ